MEGSSRMYLPVQLVVIVASAVPVKVVLSCPEWCYSCIPGYFSPLDVRTRAGQPSQRPWLLAWLAITARLVPHLYVCTLAPNFYNDQQGPVGKIANGNILFVDSSALWPYM
jgi:hypothetical protein